MGKESVATARHRAERRARGTLVASAVLGLACGDLQQAAESSASGGEDGDGTDATGAFPDDGSGLPPPGDDDGASATGTSDKGSSTSEPPAEDSTSGEPLPPPGCGDGRVDEGELCDDGDDDDTDECTTLCAPPSCEDGIQSGAETDVDCGASCNGCSIDAGCATASDCTGGLVCGDGSACAWPPSCLALVQAWPETESGSWPLDPDGDGRSGSFECDMTPGDAGWTRVLLEDFDVSDGSAWSNPTITTCGALGQMLGGYGVIAGGTLSRTVDALQVAHTETRLGAEYFKIDTWDNETAFAEIDGTQVWSDVFHHSEGPTHECGSSSYNEEAHVAAGRTPQSDGSMTITFGSNLNQAATNEAWGIDDVEVWVR